MSHVSALPSTRSLTLLAAAVALALAALLATGCASNADNESSAPAASGDAASSESARDDALTALDADGAPGETPVLVAWSFSSPLSSSSATLTYDERGNLIEQTLRHSEASFESTATTTETYDASGAPTTLTISDALPAGATESRYTFDPPTLTADADGSTIIECALPDAANDYPSAQRFAYTLVDDLSRLTRTVESSVMLSGQKAESAEDLEITAENSIAQTYDYDDDGQLAVFTIAAYGDESSTTCTYDGDSMTATGEFAGEWTLNRDGEGRIVGAANEAFGVTMTFTYEARTGLTAFNRALALTRPAYALAQGLLEASSVEMAADENVPA